MKALKLTTLLLAVVMVLGSTSCKYEEGPAISLLTKKARITGEWTIEKTIEPDGTIDTDHDLVYTFEKDNTGKISSSSFTGDIQFSWELIDNKEKIQISIDGFDTQAETILKLKNKEMWVKDSDNYQTHFQKK